MKKLFLASFACRTLDRALELLPRDPKECVAAFVPTAADPYEDKAFVDVDREKLIELGFTVFDLDIKDKTEKELTKTLDTVDLILVAGGNTYYLLYHAQQSGFLSVLRNLVERGVVYVGSSAGAILACPTVDTARPFDPISVAPELANYDGLGLVDFLILPHFEKPRYLERMRASIETWSGKGYHLYPLTDQQAIIVNGDTHTFVEVKN